MIIINIKMRNYQWFKKIIMRKIKLKLLLFNKIYFEFVNFI